MKEKEYILLDGAMGTMLQKAGLPAGALPEIWNVTQPDAVTRIQKKYVEAGSQIIYANTFGANALKLRDSGYSVHQIVTAGVQAAKRAAEGTGTKVALDIGPLGHLMAPLGDMTFQRAYDLFREMLLAGEAAGADLVVFETMSDLKEVKAGVLAARENTRLPIYVTMTFEKSGRTFVGVSVASMGITLSSLGVEAMGFNCSLGPSQLLPLTEELARWTERPLMLKPNAGLPGESGQYAITPQSFVAACRRGAEMGVRIFGGCCGTNPDYIAALQEEFAGKTPFAPSRCVPQGVCSASQAVPMEEMDEIDRTISPDNEEVRQAMAEGDLDALCDLAADAMEADAVQVYLPPEYEAEYLSSAVEAIQGVTHKPLLIRAHAAAALESALRVYNGRPLAGGEFAQARALCEKYGAMWEECK